MTDEELALANEDTPSVTAVRLPKQIPVEFWAEIDEQSRLASEAAHADECRERVEAVMARRAHEEAVARAKADAALVEQEKQQQVKRKQQLERWYKRTHQIEPWERTTVNSYACMAINARSVFGEEEMIHSLIEQDPLPPPFRRWA